METDRKERHAFPLNAVRLCIDGCGADLSGRAYSRLSEKELKFYSFSEFLLKMEELFDQCGYPQSFEEKRKFSSRKQAGYYLAPKAVLTDEEIICHRGMEYTVNIFVKSRRCAGWQGCLTEDGWGQMKEYHSELELLHLICSVTGWEANSQKEQEEIV